MYVKHSLLTHSSVDGHLGRFHVLCVTDMSMHGHVPVCVPVLWSSCLVRGLWHQVFYEQLFRGITKLFFSEVEPPHSPTSNISQHAQQHLLFVFVILVLETDPQP